MYTFRTDFKDAKFELLTKSRTNYEWKWYTVKKYLLTPDTYDPKMWIIIKIWPIEYTGKKLKVTGWGHVEVTGNTMAEAADIILKDYVQSFPIRLHAFYLIKFLSLINQILCKQ